MSILQPPHVLYSSTSQAAAEQIKPLSCRLRMQVLKTIALVMAHGVTDEEGQLIGYVQANTWRPRRRECQMLGWIRDSGQTRPTKAGRQAVVWVVTNEGARALQEAQRG